MSTDDPTNEPITTERRRPRSLPTRLLSMPFLALAMVATLLAGTATAQDQEPPPIDPVATGEVTIIREKGQWTVFEQPFGRVYGNVARTDGYVVVFAGTLENVCFDPAPPTHRRRVRQMPDGTYEQRTLRHGIWDSVSVYETDVPLFDFLAQSCEAAIVDGVPLPQPFAQGHGTLMDRAWNLESKFDTYFGPQPSGRYKNSVWARLETPDGQRYKLFAQANYEVLDDGTNRGISDTFRFLPLG